MLCSYHKNKEDGEKAGGDGYVYALIMMMLQRYRCLQTQVLHIKYDKCFYVSYMSIKCFLSHPHFN